MQEKDTRKTRRGKKYSPCTANNCKRECCVTYISGFYSCKWETRPKKRRKHAFCCCSWTEQLFYPFLIIAFCMSVFLLFMWIESSNEYHGFDWVVYLVTGYWYFWSLVLLSLFGILTVYSSLLLVLGFLLLWEGYELYLHWYHKILTVLAIGICTFFMVVLFMYWKDRWLTFGLSLKIFAPYIHLSGIPMMVLLSWPVAFYLVHWEQEAVQVVVGLPFFLILLCLFVLPLGFYSPCIQDNELGPKPGIFGHRGAPMLGPENTMMAFEKAVENGAFGLESDVYLSMVAGCAFYVPPPYATVLYSPAKGKPGRDGVPFLMHDHNLRRTTNILEVMPIASYTSSHHFYWNFLSTLNAGSWFVQSERKPFYNMKPLSEADREKARNQTIPKLSDLLELANKEKKFVLFDLNGPPLKHPFRRTFVRQVVHVILNSKIEPHLIYWLPDNERQYVMSEAPGFQQVGRLNPIEALRKQNIRIINVDYKGLFYNGLRDYKAANITINLYLVNEPWLFSLAWCSRIDSVTTDDVQLLGQINYPSYFMTTSYYILMWLFLDCISAVFIFAIFYFHWWRESLKEKVFESISSYTDIESIHLRRRKSEKPEALSVSIEPPSKDRPRPQTPVVPVPHLAGSVRQPQGSKKTDSEPEPIPDTTKQLMPATDDFIQPMPLEEAFQPAQAPTQEASSQATLQTAVPKGK